MTFVPAQRAEIFLGVRRATNLAFNLHHLLVLGRLRDAPGTVFGTVKFAKPSANQRLGRWDGQFPLWVYTLIQIPILTLIRC